MNIEQLRAALHRLRQQEKASRQAIIEMDGVANGVAHRIHRLKALGNGQVPLQAAVAFKLLMDSIS